MTNEKKLRFLMRGLKTQLSLGFPEPPKAVAEFTTEAVATEKTLTYVRSNYDRQSSPVMNNQADEIRVSPYTMRETIRAVIGD